MTGLTQRLISKLSFSLERMSCFVLAISDRTLNTLQSDSVDLLLFESLLVSILSWAINDRHSRSAYLTTVRPKRSHLWKKLSVYIRLRLRQVRIYFLALLLPLLQMFITIIKGQAIGYLFHLLSSKTRSISLTSLNKDNSDIAHATCLSVIH